MANIKTILAVGIPSALVVAAGAGFVVPRLTGGDPAGSFLPGIAGGGGKDPGIAACEGMRDAPKTLASIAPNTASLDDPKVAEALKKIPDAYRELRARFQGSRYPAIRDSGTRFADASMKVLTTQHAPEDYEGMFTDLAEQGQAYKDLHDACAAQGIQIPVGPGREEG
ncbi:MAG TPA: hypothetical protein VFC19_27870 [Candidatus Limnocylindrales bacterium]|nr:hypothetical protein [Candidatus Limnocylindrales bacterium]